MSLSFVRCGEHDRGGRVGQVLEGEAVTDVAIEVGTFGIGLQELLVATWWNVKV
jgi:hypothetical protein